MRRSILAGLLGLCLQSCSTGAVDLNADFRQDGNALIIVNHDKFDYAQLDATVNGEYHYKAPALKAGESLRVPLAEFATGEGARYSADKSKLQSMALYAETTDGKPGRLELTRN
jgi:hypothetical protein